jgi:hypothetical protein
MYSAATRISASIQWRAQHWPLDVVSSSNYNTRELVVWRQIELDCLLEVGRQRAPLHGRLQQGSASVSNGPPIHPSSLVRLIWSVIGPKAVDSHGYEIRPTAMSCSGNFQKALCALDGKVDLSAVTRHLLPYRANLPTQCDISKPSPPAPHPAPSSLPRTFLASLRSSVGRSVTYA